EHRCRLLLAGSHVQMKTEEEEGGEVELLFTFSVSEASWNTFAFHATSSSVARASSHTEQQIETSEDRQSATRSLSLGYPGSLPSHMKACDVGLTRGAGSGWGGDIETDEGSQRSFSSGSPSPPPQDGKGDKGGEVEVIDMFVQKAEDCRDTTVEGMSEAVPQGDGRLGQCGGTTKEEM
ncbi:hypothetical protein KUCAC02_007503, partial [Chaenocephalus aceratus]